ncbi:phage holin family protein [Shewanella sp. D64]|uniref:phage holin family protein n=1 Tax=unclassified Shewanella TaxID=196818 RepID=UPI0022BA6CED|nr:MULTISPECIES: phage holin family protein [unclassified Shewanella]MEC4724268.1 phage holin family protein [Shewanella sp. D64]MEC4738780.1 phage holin family protein [Shewanella sp. E94]WBJ97780.1 phage holin family protein [Shewanella sp. MTB7]
MPDNNVPIIKQVIDLGFGYIWFIFLAVWGGTVNYLIRLKRDKSTAFSIVELLGEWVISGFSGLLTAFICAEMGLSFMYTAALAGIAGHMGGRGIYLLERVVRKRIGLPGGE